MLRDQGGAHEQLFRRLRIELRVRAEELEECVEAALETGLRDDVVHLRPDACHFAQPALVDIVRRRRVQGREVAHQRGVIRLAIRQFARAQRIRHIAFAHKIANLRISRDHFVFQQAPGLIPKA